MKKILLAYLILYLCLNLISCTTKNNSGENTLYFREHYGEMGWHTTGNEEKHGKYIGDIKKNKPHGQGKYTYYKNPEDSEYQFSLLIPGMPTNHSFCSNYLANAKSRQRRKSACTVYRKME